MAFSNCDIVVVAAGFSQRFGEKDKLGSCFGTGYLIDPVLETVTALGAHAAVVVHPDPDGFVASRAKAFGLHGVFNPAPQAGMARSIAVGVRALASQQRPLLLILADMPLLRPDDVAAVVRAYAAGSDSKRIVRPTFRGKPGHPVIFAPWHRPALASLESGPGARDILMRHQVIHVARPHDTVVADVDTPEALKRLEARLKEF